MMKKHFLPIAALSVLGLTSVAHAARNNQGMMKSCAPEPGATCYPDDCKTCYCLGPDNYGGNAPVCPRTCDGDFTITVAGFYWNAHQDGMEYAVDNRVTLNSGIAAATDSATVVSSIQQLNNLVDAKYLTPDFDWQFGFKVGLGYCSPCDGWDIGVLWTWYRGKADSHEEAEFDDNHALIPLWSAFSPTQGQTLYATDIDTNWRLRLNLIDIELGRNFWTSRLLSIRPHVGLRIAFIKQDYHIEHSGGSWSSRVAASGTGGTIGIQNAFNDEVELDNDYKAVGVRAGLDSYWNLGCGWAIFGNFAASIVYGRFSLDNDEWNRLATSPHDKNKVAEWEESLRVSRGILDLALGIQYSTMFCDCKYGFTAMLGWEHHLFFDQNQMWRVVRIGDTAAATLPNNTGENSFHQRRGDLDTQGWTLTVKFDF